MLHWYLINTIELTFGIIFLVAAFKFLTLKVKGTNKYKQLGAVFLLLSGMSFIALKLTVESSGILL